MPKREPDEGGIEQPPQTTMTVRLGNPAPKEGYKEDVPEGLSRKELEALAAELEVITTVSTADDTPVDDDVLIGRLNGATRFRPIHRGAAAVTTISPPAGAPLGEVFVTLTHPKGLWATQAGLEEVEVAGAGPDGQPGKVMQPIKPLWVESDNQQLANLISAHYGCPVGVPDDLEETTHTVYGPPGVGPEGKIGGGK